MPRPRSPETEQGSCAVIVTALPDRDAAEHLADRLVAEGLAASVHLREVQTRYRWKGKIETGREQILDIYAPRDRIPDVEAAIRSMHPYEMPPVHALPIVAGPPDYLRWIASAGQFPGVDES